jgi:hypothetical protein
MIARFNPRPEDLQHLQVGPIGPHLQSFAVLVSQQGYCSVTGWLKVRLVAKLSRWLRQRRVPLRELNEFRITFDGHRTPTLRIRPGQCLSAPNKSGLLRLGWWRSQYILTQHVNNARAKCPH